MTTNVAIIGATGSLGRTLREALAEDPNYAVTSFARRANALHPATNERLLQGSVLNPKELDAALSNQDAVFVALSGDLPTMARAIVESMRRVGTRRIIFTASMGIYGEVAGEPRGVVPAILQPYRQAADIVEASGLDYTILRPGWFDDGPDTTCQVTTKGEPFAGHDVSRAAIIAVVKELIDTDGLYVGESLGLYR